MLFFHKYSILDFVAAGNGERLIMRYEHMEEAVFESRPNRFIANVKNKKNETIICHVKNTGRCKELLIPGTKVYIQKAQNPERKTLYDLITVQKDRNW